MLSLALLSRVAEYLRGTMTLRELQEWYAIRLPILAYDPHSDDANLIAAIELGLVEMSEGSITEDELRVLLKDEIEGYTTSAALYPPGRRTITETGSSNTDWPTTLSSDQWVTKEIMWM